MEIVGSNPIGVATSQRRIAGQRARRFRYPRAAQTGNHGSALLAGRDGRDAVSGEQARCGLARELGYSEEEAGELGLAAVLHDIGKMSGRPATYLRRAAGGLAAKLHAHLRTARDWQRVVSGDPRLHDAHLQRVLADLRQSVEEASLLLLHAEIVLATFGPTPSRLRQRSICCWCPASEADRRGGGRELISPLG